MENLFSANFWSNLSQKGMDWIVTELPGLLIIVILFFVALRVIRFSMKRLRKAFIHRADKKDMVDTEEAEKRISNMTKDWSAMVFDIGVAYKENLDKVMELMKEVGDQMKADEDFSDKIIEPIEIFGVDEFGDSAITIKARLKTKPIQQWTVGREYRKRLKETFDKHNIEIPFPHTTVYWGEEISPLELNMKKSA